MESFARNQSGYLAAVQQGRRGERQRKRSFRSKSVGTIDLDKIEEGLLARDHQVFVGAFDPKDLGFFTRQLFESATIRNASPSRDFRDWNEIEGWSNSIALSWGNSKNNYGIKNSI